MITSPHASISVMREYWASALVTLTRIRSVVKALKLIVCLTRLLPATVASVTQAEPFQPCTEKSLMPYWEKARLSVGSTGFRKSSCSVNTTTRSMALLPLKLICTQSG